MSKTYAENYRRLLREIKAALSRQVPRSVWRKSPSRWTDLSSHSPDLVRDHVSHFPSLQQEPGILALQRGRVYFVSRFRGCSNFTLFVGAMVRLHTRAGVMAEEAAHFCCLRSLRGRRRRPRVQQSPSRAWARNRRSPHHLPKEPQTSDQVFNTWDLGDVSDTNYKTHQPKFREDLL